ncbi:hypothetical protein BCR33DRAFT_733222 [Rhizoclosmatium globosum]|uniref:CBM21 domain-containing protein n=1 Tax=Rhizoclosmatium globosum TaxID=329046 RepID=A0A1Y2CZQ4_9FUNG|nr:hypothetical protein BCR33DRAFT_733222 [Rhizoclosmatium globosum]|eukprot:ORY52532.1 hypothetical protein BCR33DRAFT_733222 [Rhizoclosmatium globosum]
MAPTTSFAPLTTTTTTTATAPTRRKPVRECSGCFSSTQNGGSSTANVSGDGLWVAVSRACPAHWPRSSSQAASSTASGTVLEGEDRDLWRHSARHNVSHIEVLCLREFSQSHQGFHRQKNRVSFNAEVACFFDGEEPVSVIASEQVFARPILPSQEPKSEVALSSWSILSATTPSPISPITYRLKSAPIALETACIVRNSNGVASNFATLHLTFLINNLHYEKQVTVTYTSNAWKSSSTSSTAKYVGSPSPGLDRFSLEIECDTSAGTQYMNTSDRLVNIEFAAKLVMGGNESWDNRDGRNHLIIIKSASSDQATTLTRKTRSFPDLDADNSFKRKEELLALKRGQTMSNEAKSIDEEFWRDWAMRKQYANGSSTVESVTPISCKLSPPFSPTLSTTTVSSLTTNLSTSTSKHSPATFPSTVFPTTMNARRNVYTPTLLLVAEPVRVAVASAARVYLSSKFDSCFDSPLYAEPVGVSSLGLTMEIPLSSSPRY